MFTLSIRRQRLLSVASFNSVNFEVTHLLSFPKHKCFEEPWRRNPHTSPSIRYCSWCLSLLRSSTHLNPCGGFGVLPDPSIMFFSQDIGFSSKFVNVLTFHNSAQLCGRRLFSTSGTIVLDMSWTYGFSKGCYSLSLLIIWKIGFQG